MHLYFFQSCCQIGISHFRTLPNLSHYYEVNGIVPRFLKFVGRFRDKSLLQILTGITKFFYNIIFSFLCGTFFLYVFIKESDI